MILLTAFLSGVLSVLAPCVLPVLPVIFGGSGTDLNKQKTRRILGSALIFIFIFTFLLKVSTVLIDISQQTWTALSGGIILFYGLTIVFPMLWVRLQTKLPTRGRPKQQSGKWGDILLGASLGPIFTTCSPTYTLLLATILPQSISQGVLGIIAYLVGFGGFLYLLLLGGRTMVKKIMGLADESGIFKKILGWILIITGVLVMSGRMKHLEARMVQHLPNTTYREQQLLEIIQQPEKKTLSAPQQSMSSGYRLYNKNTLPTTGTIILFFHADRCPTCNEAEKNFLASDIPDGLTILKVNYDTESELKKKYQILTQTSYVLIHPDGTMIKRWVGGRTLKELQTKIAEVKNNFSHQTVKMPSGTQAVAYLAGGCFRCMEGPLEALEGVKEVISGYAGGDQSTASYKLVGRGDTGHREAIKVVYDPGLISYEEILATYRTQIDPTDGSGQFGDRGFQYTPAIYFQTSEEQQIAETSKQRLDASKTFKSPIAVQIVPFTSFFDAEEEHQDFYKKQSEYYASYKKGSGRAGFIETYGTGIQTIFKSKETTPNLSHLTAQQKDILFNGGTESPFNNAYRDNHEAGIYVDVIDGTPLFSSTDKFDSGTGRPSFTRPIDEALVSMHSDNKLRMERTEIKSKTSNGHLGHIFDDGPSDKGGKRYCINSAALRFVPLKEMNTPEYEKYLVLFQ